MKKKITINKASESSVITDSKPKKDVDRSKFKKSIESKMLKSFEEDLVELDKITNTHLKEEIEKVKKSVESKMLAAFEDDMKTLDDSTDEYIKDEIAKAVKTAESTMIKSFEEDLGEIDDAVSMYIESELKKVKEENLEMKDPDFDDVDADANTSDGTIDIDEEVKTQVDAKVKEVLEDVKSDLGLLEEKLESYINGVKDELMTEVEAGVAEDMFALDEIVNEYVDDVKVETEEKVYESVKAAFGTFAVKRVKALESRKMNFPNIDPEAKYTKVGESSWLKIDKTGLTTKATEEEMIDLEESEREDMEGDELAEYVDSVMDNEEVTIEELKEIITMLKDEIMAIRELVEDESMEDFEEEELEIDDELIEDEEEFEDVELDDVDEEMLNDLDGLDEEDTEQVMESISLGKIKGMDHLKKIVKAKRYQNGFDFKKATETRQFNKNVKKEQFAKFVKNADKVTVNGKIETEKNTESAHPLQRFF